jgi:YVTN family beta-propeller protein
MKPLARVVHYGLLAIAGISMFFNAGCTGNSPPGFNHGILPIFVGIEIWRVCVPFNPNDPNTPYEQFNVEVNPDGSTQDVDVQTTLNRSNCDYSVGSFNEVDPSAVQASLGTTTTTSTASPFSRAARSVPDATSPAPHAVDALPYFRPIPFLPGFSATDAAIPAVMCDPNGSFYSVNHGNSLVTHFAGCTLTAIATIPVFQNPLHPAMTPDGSLLLVTSNAGAVNFISTATDTVVFTLQTPGLSPSGIDISPDGSTAYVTNYDVNAEILVIDIPSRTITKTIPLPVQYPKQIFLTPDGAQAWVNFYGNSQIYILDTFSGTVAATIGTGNMATTGIAFNATGTTAYVAAAPNDLLVYNTASLTRTGDIKVGSQPVDVFLTPDGARLYVTSFSSSTISIVDAHTNLLLTNLTAPGVDQRGFVLIPTVP